MADQPDHPITTPKGAVVFTLVLAVIGVFAPFLFSLGGARWVAVVATVVIIWIYWSEVRGALSDGRWNMHLAVPIGAIAIIVAVALTPPNISPPPPPSPLNVENLASKLGAFLLRNQPPPKARPTIYIPAPDVKVILKQEPPPPAAPQTMSSSNEWATVAAQINRTNAANRAQRACDDLEIKLSVGLHKLVVDAAMAEINYNNNRNDHKFEQAYMRWIGSVETFFADHKDNLPDTSAFDKARGDPGGKTFLLIHNSGYHIAKDLDAKVVALNKIRDATSALPCPSQNVDG